MKYNKKIAYKTIVAAKQGDTDAISDILHYYEQYICYFARRTVYDMDGCPHDIIDENIKRQIEAEYLTAFWLYYDIHRLPKGETLE